MMKIRKNDKVKILKGKDKGKTGKVLRLEPDKNRLYVEGINIIKRHTRQQGQNKPGGIISKEGPIDISNVTLVCPNCSKPTRVGFEIQADREKVRVCKKCDSQIQ